MGKNKNKKKASYKMPTYRKYIKQSANIGASVTKAGFVLVPAIIGAQHAVAEGPMAGVNFAVYEMTGYDIPSKKLDSGKLKEVAIRGGLLLAIGMGLSYAAKRV